MIEGHGDDSYKYSRPITANFSSNVYSRVDLSALKAHLCTRIDGIGRRMAGLLHDIDFEQWPEQHCVKCIELLQSAHATPELIHAICCHGYGICTDVEPTLPMEKILFAADELTGLIGAATKMRPSKSCTDMELSSLKKKFKDKKFAAGCSRDVIRTGAERLGWTLDELLEKTLHAMADTESTVAEELNLLLQA